MEASQALYDLTYIKSIIGDDEAELKKMLTIFNSSTPETLMLMRQAFESNNLPELGKWAHKLKSSIDMMGVESLRQRIRQLELSAKNQSDTELIPQWHEEVQQVMATVIDDISSRLLD